MKRKAKSACIVAEDKKIKPLFFETVLSNDIKNEQEAILKTIVNAISQGNEYYNLEFYDMAIDSYTRALLLMDCLKYDRVFYESMCYASIANCFICNGDFNASAFTICKALLSAELSERDSEYLADLHIFSECERNLRMLEAFCGNSQLVGCQFLDYSSNEYEEI